MADVREVDIRRLGHIDYAQVQQMMRDLQTQRLEEEISDTTIQIQEL